MIFFVLDRYGAPRVTAALGEGATGLGPLEMLDDGRADVALAQAHHIGHKAAAVLADHLHGPAQGVGKWA